MCVCENDDDNNEQQCASSRNVKGESISSLCCVIFVKFLCVVDDTHTQQQQHSTINAKKNVSLSKFKKKFKKMIAASWFGRFNKWWGSKYVYFVMIVLLLIEIQIWLTQGQASVSEQRRLELDLPSIWICPRNEDVVPTIKRCEFESVSRGGVRPCSTMERVEFANVFGLNCAVVSNVDGSPMKVFSEKDAAVARDRVGAHFSRSRDRNDNEEDGGVVVVIGRDELFGNQWFFAKKEILLLYCSLARRDTNTHHQ